MAAANARNRFILAAFWVEEASLTSPRNAEEAGKPKDARQTLAHQGIIRSGVKWLVVLVHRKHVRESFSSLIEPSLLKSSSKDMANAPHNRVSRANPQDPASGIQPLKLQL
jgi:hypothetical protein